jgi:hypothetical protein
MKQTAVEWLEIEIRELEATRNERSLSLHLDLYNEYFKQAKEMEKEQIEQAYFDGTNYMENGFGENPTDYYIQTYKTETIVEHFKKE